MTTTSTRQQPFPSLPLLAALLLVPLPAAGELGTLGEHRILQNEVGGAIETGDRFGAALAVGDFDNDGYFDLAIGTPEEDPAAVSNAGAVYVVYGSPAGLNGSGARAPLTIHQDQLGVEDAAEVNDLFGSALAVGNFNGDLYDDLAVGMPGENGFQGGFQVFYGSATGLDPADDDVVIVDLGLNAEMGFSLAAGPFGSDPYDDLLVGVPGYAVFNFPNPIPESDAGAALFISGSATGIDLGSAVLAGAGNDGGDRYGSALAIGHVNNDGGDAEILAGAPLAEAGGGPFDEGIVYIHGTSTASLEGGSQDGHFGGSLLLADFFGVGYPQLLVGQPGVTVSELQAGAAWFYGFPGFPIPVYQGSDLPETPEAGDRFGEVLAAGDFDGDGLADAVFGVPFEDLDGPVADAGVVQLVYGDAFAYGTPHFQIWEAEDFGDPAQAYAHFGKALAAGDFDGDGRDDLAIGIPGETVSGQVASGAVQILYATGCIFGDGFESGDASAWSP